MMSCLVFRRNTCPDHTARMGWLAIFKFFADLIFVQTISEPKEIVLFSVKENNKRNVSFHLMSWLRTCDGAFSIDVVIREDSDPHSGKFILPPGPFQIGRTPLI